MSQPGVTTLFKRVQAQANRSAAQRGPDFERDAAALTTACSRIIYQAQQRVPADQREDFAQDLLCWLFTEGLHRWQAEGGKFSAWFATVARRRAVDMWRKVSRQPDRGQGGTSHRHAVEAIPGNKDESALPELDSAALLEQLPGFLSQAYQQPRPNLEQTLDFARDELFRLLRRDPPEEWQQRLDNALEIAQEAAEAAHADRATAVQSDLKNPDHWRAFLLKHVLKLTSEQTGLLLGLKSMTARQNAWRVLKRLEADQ